MTYGNYNKATELVLLINKRKAQLQNVSAPTKIYLSTYNGISLELGEFTDKRIRDIVLKDIEDDIKVLEMELEKL